MTSYPERHSVMSLGDSYLNYIDAGRGQAILLGHSYLWDVEMWRPQIDALASHYRVIAPDLWGHGRSGPMPSDLRTMSDMARYYFEFLDELGIDDVVIAGLSIGGMWGVEMLAQAPHRVSGLALINTYVGPEPEGMRENNFALLSALEDNGSVSEAMLDAIEPLFFSPATLENKPDLPARFRSQLLTLDSGTLRRVIVPLGRLIFGRADRREVLGGVTTPCVVVSGADDHARPPHEGREMAQLLDCPYVEIPAAGHIAALEASESVTDTLIALLRRVERHHAVEHATVG
jgi:pimeloyl-ACP methyl ester carboxylesterase